MAAERRLKGYMRRDKAGWLVGAGNPASDYRGPEAVVSYANGWLHINTDDYEGHAMLNIEALPYLRRALAQIAKEQKARPPR